MTLGDNFWILFPWFANIGYLPWNQHFVCLFIFRQKLFGHLIRDLRLVGVWRTLLWIMEWRRKRTNKYICILVNKYVNICIRRGRDPRTAWSRDRPVPIGPRFSKFCCSVRDQPVLVRGSLRRGTIAFPISTYSRVQYQDDRKYFRL